MSTSVSEPVILQPKGCTSNSTLCLAHVGTDCLHCAPSPCNHTAPPMEREPHLPLSPNPDMGQFCCITGALQEHYGNVVGMLCVVLLVSVCRHSLLLQLWVCPSHGFVIGGACQDGWGLSMGRVLEESSVSLKCCVCVRVCMCRVCVCVLGVGERVKWCVVCFMGLFECVLCVCVAECMVMRSSQKSDLFY